METCIFEYHSGCLLVCLVAFGDYDSRSKIIERRKAQHILNAIHIISAATGFTISLDDPSKSTHEHSPIYNHFEVPE